MVIMEMRTLWALFVAFIFSSLQPGPVSSVKTGTLFVTAFLENLAYYYPSPPNNRLLITAFADYTDVNVTVANGNFTSTLNLHAQQTQMVNLPPSVELQGSTVSFKTVIVSSSNTIAVLSVSTKANSTETSIVYPIASLGTTYHVASPPNPYSFRPFQFVIINTGQNSSVTVSQGSNTTQLQLKPYENVQLYLTPLLSAYIVSSSFVAVLFGHSCEYITACNCSFAFEQLPSTLDWGMTFIVPTLPITNGEDNLLLLETSQENQYILSSFPAGSQMSSSPPINQYMTLSQSMSAIIRGPGLLMNLLPVEKWSSNFMLIPIAGFSNHALVIAKTSDIDMVHLGDQPLNPSLWVEVPQSEFSQINVNLSSDTTVQFIWHSYSTIAVYHFGTNSDIYFGTPAVSYKDSAGNINVMYSYGTWTGAIQQCTSSGSELVSIFSTEIESMVQQALNTSAYKNINSVWIGLRQSLSRGDWYWISKDPLSFTRWASGEPMNSYENKCVQMSLLENNQFTWSTDNCCTYKPFVCFKWGTQF